MALYPSDNLVPANNLFPDGEVHIFFTFSVNYSKIGSTLKNVSYGSKPNQNNFSSNPQKQQKASSSI